MNFNPARKADVDAPDFWHIGPPNSPVIVENADLLLPYLPYFLSGWDIRWAGSSIDGLPVVRVEEQDDTTVRVVSRGPGAMDLSFNNPYDAASGLADSLIGIYIARAPRSIRLCAGAAMIDEGLVVFIEDPIIEKSGIALHLAVLGSRFFGNDQIAVRVRPQATGTCLGLMPMVSLPLPEDCGYAFREFVDGYSSMQYADSAYLKLWEGEAADFGESAPITALGFLDRIAGAPAVLEPAMEPDQIRDTLSAATKLPIVTSDIFYELTRPAVGVAFYRLRFSSSREAAALLSRKFRAATPK